MALLMQELSATWLDLIAFAFLFAAWGVYVSFTARRWTCVTSLHNRMDHYRRLWMVRMIQRDNRMVDINVIRNIMRSAQFFASTAMLVLGALIALTGYLQQTLDVVSGLPFTMKASTRLLEIKIAVLVVIFVYAFFKFTWSIRQLNYCSIMVAAAPPPPDDNPEQYATLINSIARITSLAAVSFNNGLRAYYFALAALAWFLHPWLMILGTACVIAVLYRREFMSRTLQAMMDEDTSPTLRM